MPVTNWVDNTHYTAPTVLAIVANAISVTQLAHTVGGGTLTTINSGAANVLAVVNDEVMLRPSAPGGQVTIQPVAAGNIRTQYGQTLLLNAIEDWVLLRFNGAFWMVVDSSVIALLTSTLTLTAGGVIGGAGLLSEEVLVDTFGAVARQVLTTINGGTTGQNVRIRAASGARRVVLDNLGNIRTQQGIPMSVMDPVDYVDLQFNGTNWVCIGFNQAVSNEAGTNTVATSGTPTGPLPMRMQQVKIPLASLTAGAVTQDVVLGATLPAGSVVLDGFFNVRTIYTGVAMQTVTVSLGTVAALGSIRAASVDLIAAAATGFFFAARGVGIGTPGGGLQLTARFTTTNGNVNQITDGAMDVTVVYCVAPNI
mgnify:FL=1